MIFLFYKKLKSNNSEARIAQDIYLITALSTATAGITIGGPRALVSLVGVCASFCLFFNGLKLERFSLRVASAIFFVVSVGRLLAVDGKFEFIDIHNPYDASRLILSIAGIVSVFACTEWLRRKTKETTQIENVFLPAASFMTAGLILNFFYQDALNAWISLIWGSFATFFVIGGFASKEKVYRWSGLGMFVFVLLRLFLHDFAKLETLFKIFSFMGLGVILIAVSLVYSNFSKQILQENSKN